MFFAFAIGIGLWSGAIPILLRQSGTDVEGLGFALALHTGAYIGAMSLAGQVARRVRARRLMLLALPAHGLAFAAIFAATSPAALTVSLLLMGLTGGTLDLAMNAEGNAVERAMGRPVLTRMHASASAAFAAGAILGSVLGAGSGPLACSVIVLAITLPVALAVWRLPDLPAVAAATPAAPAGAGPGSARPPDGADRSFKVVVRYGLVLGLAIAAEMSAQMWSARLLERQAAELAAFAGAGAAFFAGCQALMRLFGDALRHRFGDRRLIIGSLLIAILGFAVVAASPTFAASLAGFALIGIGMGCVVPCIFVLVAASAPRSPAGAIGTASLLAGLIRLPAPMVLGWLVAEHGDATAFGVIAVSLVGAVLVVMARRPARPVVGERA